MNFRFHKGEKSERHMMTVTDTSPQREKTIDAAHGGRSRHSEKLCRDQTERPKPSRPSGHGHIRKLRKQMMGSHALTRAKKKGEILGIDTLKH